MEADAKKVAAEILKIAKKYYRYQDTSGLRPSRRVQGQWSNSVEEKGFEAGYIYFDIRLVDRIGQVCEILERVDSKLPRFRPCYRHLFTFGWSEEELHCSIKRVPSSYPIRKGKWRELIGNIESSEAMSGTGIIPDLLPPRKPGKFPPVFRNPQKGDLFIWIVDGESGVHYTGYRGKGWSAASRTSVVIKANSLEPWEIVEGKTFWVQ